MERCVDEAGLSPRFGGDHTFDDRSGRGFGGSNRRRTLQPLVAALLVLGLAVAVVTDGALPDAWAKGLFGVLLVLDAVTIEWLTRPRGA